MFSFQFFCSALRYLVWLFPLTLSAPSVSSRAHQPLHHFPFANPPHTFQPFSPLFTSFVYEIRWFLLGEASVHPSAAPSCPCPTPSIQVISKPANSHSLSITYCFISTSIFYVYPCPHALRSTPWQAHLLIGRDCWQNAKKVHFAWTVGINQETKSSMWPHFSSSSSEITSLGSFFVDKIVRSFVKRNNCRNKVKIQ